MQSCTILLSDTASRPTLIYTPHKQCLKHGSCQEYPTCPSASCYLMDKNSKVSMYLQFCTCCSIFSLTEHKIIGGSLQDGLHNNFAKILCTPWKLDVTKSEVAAVSVCRLVVMYQIIHSGICYSGLTILIHDHCSVK